MCAADSSLRTAGFGGWKWHYDLIMELYKSKGGVQRQEIILTVIWCVII